MFKSILLGVVFSAGLVVSGCSETAVVPTADAITQAIVPAPTPAPATAPEAAIVADCTWQTELEPGIPGSPGHLIPSPLNPNGQSELAALMREMETYMKAVRQAIVAGAPLPAVSDRQAKLSCTWPTTASDRNPAFDGFALSYHAAVDHLYKAPAGPAQREAYGSVLATCRTCHENSCPGPLMAIDALSFARLENP